MEMVNADFTFSEINEEELMNTDGGLILINPVIVRTAAYLVNCYNYNMQVSEINGYNDTVTSNGRPDLVKSYPEKPTW